ncbi:MAG: cob(I)yrinic acid a,c-diamide adenosyltransferase [Candidatus Levyibacteriota bacterium]
MPIYTKTGDKGKTSLFTGKRVFKDDPRIEAYGALDELNSVIGVILSSTTKTDKESIYITQTLLGVQVVIFPICSYLAGLKDVLKDIQLEEKIKKMEKDIDYMTDKMPTLNNFILPGGGVVGSHLHLARTVTRRAERHMVKLGRKQSLDPLVIKYINRLSDLFFTLARYANNIEKKKETIWER